MNKLHVFVLLFTGSALFFAGYFLGISKPYASVTEVFPSVPSVPTAVVVGEGAMLEDSNVDITYEKEASDFSDVVRMAPPTFVRFKAEFEVFTVKDETKDYALRQARELRSLVQSIPTVSSVEVVSLQGGEECDEAVVYHDLLGK